MDEPADDAMADESMAPVKVGLIAQVEELMAFPEVPAVAQAYVDYFNAELGGVNGHPIELVVCGAGDAVESHIACANEFVNADDVHVVINGGFLSNSIVSGTILAEAGVANLGLGNDFIDYLTPNLYNFDPGLPGLAQVFFVFAKNQRDVSTMSLFLADDPAIAPFEPALYAIGESNGITITETIYLGFEPDLTGPVSAADTSMDGWLFVLADGAQCTAAASGAATVGYDGHIFGNDLCLSQDPRRVGRSGRLVGPDRVQRADNRRRRRDRRDQPGPRHLRRRRRTDRRSRWLDAGADLHCRGHTGRGRRRRRYRTSPCSPR